MIPDYVGPENVEPVTHEPGIYFNLPMERYRSDPALGTSSINALNVSPITYWRGSHMNPDREADETDATDFGDALHARLLEGPEVFASRFVPALDESQFPDVPKSGAELEARCVALGITKSGTKAEKEARIAAKDPAFLSWSAIESAYGKQHAGKSFLKAEVMSKIERTSQLVSAHPDASKALTGGYPEVSIFWEDPETGVRCKARLDRLKSAAAIDLKSFSNKGGTSIDRAIASSIQRYGYLTQAVHYSEGLEMVKQMIRLGEAYCGDDGSHAAAMFRQILADAKEHKFFFVFVESCQYPAIRVRECARLAPEGGETIYWKSAREKVHRALNTYKACMAAFGPNRPWVDLAPSSPFTEEELIYAV